MICKYDSAKNLLKEHRKKKYAVGIGAIVLLQTPFHKIFKAHSHILTKLLITKDFKFLQKPISSSHYALNEGERKGGGGGFSRPVIWHTCAEISRMHFNPPYVHIISSHYRVNFLWEVTHVAEITSSPLCPQQ